MNKIRLFLVLLAATLFGGAFTAHAQFYSVGVNTLALPAVVADVDISMTINRNWSVHTDLSLAPFRIEGYRTQHLAVRPQVRYWLSESYRGWFFGGHALFAGYHLSLPDILRHRLKGIAVGGGVDIGYQLPIHPRWNVEFQLGGSLLWTDYLRYELPKCGELIDERSGITFLPTKVGISLVYLF